MMPESYSTSFKDKKLVRALISKLAVFKNRPMRFMEVCGTHTMSIFRHGIRSILPSNIELISGPGCPVCVTSAQDIDNMIALASYPNVIIATFGDLIRVPGTNGSLAEARAKGAKVEIVYSPTDALKIAYNNPSAEVVFLGIGFETTVPGVAASLLEAYEKQITNFSIYSVHKTMPKALDVLLSDPELKIDGLICPGHVSAIIGAKSYESLAQTKQIPCVVAGFEPADIVQAILMLAKQVDKGQHEVINCYPRAVSWEGNQRALHIMYKAFKPCKTVWRGLGPIESSGLEIKDYLTMFDASSRFSLKEAGYGSANPKGCLCGEVIKGKKKPVECSLFAKACTPTKPIGPCMVSSEGSCAAYYKYGGV